jgi:hypothetical protein
MYKKSIGFIILVHDNPTAVQRLVARLSAPWAQIFVHIDRKVHASDFSSLGDVEFVPDALRVPVFWGGFSHTAATLASLRFALDTHPSIDRFVLLSGADYAIKPRDEIKRFFDAHPTTEFVRIDRQLTPDGPNPLDWYLKYYAGDVPLFHETHSPLPPLAALARRIAPKIPHRPPEGVAIYHGAMWWALTRDGARTVIRFVDDNKALMRWIKRTHECGELFVQTALKAGGRTLNLSQDATTGTVADPTLHGVHYIDWSQGGPHPKPLEMTDLPALERSPALFARKFSKSSTDVLDKLDALHTG